MGQLNFLDRDNRGQNSNGPVSEGQASKANAEDGG